MTLKPERVVALILGAFLAVCLYGMLNLWKTYKEIGIVMDVSTPDNLKHYTFNQLHHNSGYSVVISCGHGTFTLDGEEAFKYKDLQYSDHVDITYYELCGKFMIKSITKQEKQ